MVGVSNDVIKRPTMSFVLTVFTAVSAIKKWFWQYKSNVEVFSDHKPLRQFNLVRWLQNMYNRPIANMATITPKRGFSVATVAKGWSLVYMLMRVCYLVFHSGNNKKTFKKKSSSVRCVKIKVSAFYFAYIIQIGT